MVSPDRDGGGGPMKLRISHTPAHEFAQYYDEPASTEPISVRAAAIERRGGDPMAVAACLFAGQHGLSLRDAIEMLGGGR